MQETLKVDKRETTDKTFMKRICTLMTYLMLWCPWAVHQETCLFICPLSHQQVISFLLSDFSSSRSWWFGQTARNDICPSVHKSWHHRSHLGTMVYRHHTKELPPMLYQYICYFDKFLPGIQMVCLQSRTGEGKREKMKY